MIAQFIQTLAKTSDEVYSVVGKVAGVDESARTCEVEPLNGDAVLFDIRLQGEQGRSDGVVVIPKVGSWVVVTFTEKTDGYVALCSEAEKVLWGIGSNKLEYTKDGLHVGNAVSDLKTELENLIGLVDALLTTLQTFTVATNVGPSIGVVPPTLTSLVQHKVDLALVKEKLLSLLK